MIVNYKRGQTLTFLIVTLRASRAAAQCIVIGPVFVGVFVCLWVCYHDNSKLHASILTILGLYVKVKLIKFWLSRTPGKGV